MDRRWALLVALLMVPAAQGQTQVLEDGGGDAETTAGGQQAPAGTVAAGPYDLRAFFVEEEPQVFAFTVQVEDLALDSTDFGNGVIHAQFQHADHTYRVSWLRYQFESVQYQGELRQYDGGSGYWNLIERGSVDIDGSTHTLSFEVAREMLIDGNGTAPQAGRLLDGFQAHSRGGGGFFGPEGAPVQVSDRMPDEGAGTPYEVVHGLAQSGHAHLWSDNPVRASNGEKGTFVFMVEASNMQEDEDRFDLEATGVPEGWEVTLPAATLRLGGNFTRAFPVLVTVPFQHTHGAFEDFVLEMQSQSDASAVGRTQLGIRYLAIPQPAGHHDQVFIHTRADANRDPGTFGALFEDATVAYMNTLEDDELDEDVGVPGEGFSSRHTWRVLLEPGLQMGLDFDRNRTGELHVQIDSELDLAQAELKGALYHLRGQPGPDGSIRAAEQTLLADIVPSSPVDIRGPTVLEAVLQPTAASDFVAYDPHAALMLEVIVDAQPAVPPPPMQETVPHLQGGQMRLPLNEYRDPVEGILNSLAGLSFRHDSPPERLVNPAETVLFNLTLRNDGAVDDVFSLRVNGTNALWARLLGDQKIFVPTGGERLVVAAIAPPQDAPDGDIIDLIVTAASQADPSIQGNIRVVAVVDTKLDHPDEGHLVQDVDSSLREKKKASALPVLGPLALLALGAWRRRR